ncbi:DASS family sodium-coupled anion symporter [Pseudomonas seleniipraecipitans]|uniref:DASS family sodium-coupled anion symporter n=1 Tax=Phytopseudomonas seleniipraecipitans TaxID=640205 RepID=A0ABY5J925_9GAMM|nr:DASS family sodium-coupled anion symporter [Pseudomonas seleniipraecipitans]UUD64530.1 DASS family sodium-coupled anion symporter [Pseudomonas seleniipraecipitans]
MTETRQTQGAIIAARIGFFVGPLLLLAVLLTAPPKGLSEEAWMAAGLVGLMGIWWATEAIPIPATALLPIPMIPLLGIGSVQDATSPYANPTIFLFLGGFLLGLGMQRWNLHKRLALRTLMAVGNQPARQIGGFMLATALVAMWVSNTATAIMMLPIGMSVIAMLTQQGEEREHERFATALLLGIAYAASIGGIASLIGTPPNALLAAFLRENHNVNIGFGQWMLIGVPVATCVLLFTWWWLTRGGFRLEGDSRSLLSKELSELGGWSSGEKRVAVVFALTAAAWVTQPLLSQYVDAIDDTLIAMVGAVALFLIPADRDGSKRVFLMDWDTANKVPWGILLLFGGGLSLAAAITSTGLAEWIGEALKNLGALPLLLMIGVVALTINLLTEITSNTATAAAFLPLVAALAVSQGLPPELLAIPATIAASCAFMMPVATPPNALVFGTGLMKIQSMIKAGFVINMFSVVIVTLLCYLLVGVIWSH